MEVKVKDNISMGQNYGIIWEFPHKTELDFDYVEDL
jgi:hypothetical protein